MMLGGYDQGLVIKAYIQACCRKKKSLVIVDTHVEVLLIQGTT